MNKELIGPAALITAELLRRAPTNKMEATPEVIGSAFEAAYQGLLHGLQRVESQEPGSHWENGQPGE